MSYIYDGVSLFGENDEIELLENVRSYQGCFRIKKIAIPSVDELQLWFGRIDPIRDNLCLEFKVGDREAVVVAPDSPQAIGEKLSLLQDDVEGLEKGELISLKVIIKKSIYTHDGASHLSVFSLSAFGLHLWESTLADFRFWADSEALRSDYLCFDVWHEVVSSHTTRFSFSPVYPVASIEQRATAEQRAAANQLRLHTINKRDKCGHFANASALNYIPEDFKLSHPLEDVRVNSLFNGLCLTYLMVFLCDISSLNGSEISLKLRGYKLISEVFSFKDIGNFSAAEYYEIYSWVYSEGNFTDKIGLARNLISIHLRGHSLLSIEPGVIHSLESGYDIYLKENVRQYIEIKNKLSEFIQESSDKAGSIAASMFSSMKTSLWASISFFISVFVLQVLDKKGAESLVSTDVLLISYGLFLVSFVFLFVARKEASSEIERFEESYFSLKERYRDLLNSSDLERILQGDEIYRKDMNYISTRIAIYTRSWILIALIMALVVTILWGSGSRV